MSNAISGSSKIQSVGSNREPVMIRPGVVGKESTASKVYSSRVRGSRRTVTREDSIEVCPFRFPLKSLDPINTQSPNTFFFVPLLPFLCQQKLQNGNTYKTTLKCQMSALNIFWFLLALKSNSSYRK